MLILISRSRQYSVGMCFQGLNRNSPGTGEAQQRLQRTCLTRHSKHSRPLTHVTKPMRRHCLQDPSFQQHSNEDSPATQPSRRPSVPPITIHLPLSSCPLVSLYNENPTMTTSLAFQPPSTACRASLQRVSNFSIVTPPLAPWPCVITREIEHVR